MKKEESPKSSFLKAKRVVFQFLKIRLRSEAEIIQKLKNKHFDDDTIKKLVLFFKKLGLIDDIKFSKLWVEERLKKPLGFYRIRKELSQKGISPEIIDKAILEKKDTYDEKQVILETIQKKIKNASLPLSIKHKRRLYNYFVRRGFDIESVAEIINNL